MTALSHWPDKDDARAMARMTYPDGTRIARGDLVRVDGREDAGVCEVAGFSPPRGEVLALSPTAGLVRAGWWKLSSALD